MSERKVLQKYYPPDFDPSALGRVRKPRDAVTKLQPVRLMAPFSMRCTVCGEFIYKGRKFNARKEDTGEKYYKIRILRFYIRCTRCSAEITFRTDPKNMDYAAEKGCRRNFEVWREAQLAEETEEETLDRLEREEAERDAMKELEEKTMDAKTEMAVADKLDEIRTRNARMERMDKSGEAVVGEEPIDTERERQENEDAEAARLAFQKITEGMGLEDMEEEEVVDDAKKPAIPTEHDFQPTKKRKKDHGALLGIKKRKPLLA